MVPQDLVVNSAIIIALLTPKDPAKGETAASLEVLEVVVLDVAFADATAAPRVKEPKDSNIL